MAGIEVPVPTETGTVVIDVVMFQPDRNVILAGEAKSGVNVEADQARRYGRLLAKRVVQAASINVRRSGELHIQPVYCCLTANLDRILQGLEAAPLACPVLAFSNNAIKHDGAPFADQPLNEAFAVPVPLPGPPPRIIPVDEESHESLFDELVRTVLISELSRRQTEVSVPTIAELALPHLAIYAAAARNRLIRKINAAAQRAAEANDTIFEYLGRTGTRDFSVVRFLRSPEDATPQGRTQTYQAILRSRGRRVSSRAKVDDRQLGFEDLMEDFLQTGYIADGREDEQ